jgi:hypothetical protein
MLIQPGMIVLHACCQQQSGRDMTVEIMLAYTREVDSAFHASWLVALLRISLHYSHPDKNKMASRFVPVTDEQIFVLNEATVSSNTKKATKFWCLWCYSECISTPDKLEKYAWPRWETNLRPSYSPEYTTPTQRSFGFFQCVEVFFNF